MFTNYRARTGRNLILIGYRGSGKTTIGKDLARNLGLNFLDTDTAIQETTRQSIRDIFVNQGEPAFREMETATLTTFASQMDLEPSVIATGGGIVMRPENRELLKRLGLVVWIEVTPQIAIQRISQDLYTAEQRPALTDHSLADEVHKMIAERTPIYRELADVQISNNDDETDPDMVADCLISELRNTDWYSNLVKLIDT